MICRNLFRNIVFGILFIVTLAGTISARIVTVTTNDDTNDGVCDAHCTLREAVDLASRDDIVIFDRSLRGRTIELRSTLNIHTGLTIDGPNRSRITLSGNGTFGIIDIHTPDGHFVYIDGLIITNGFAQSGGGISLGGYDNLRLTDCLITTNRASRGGGIGTFDGRLWMIGCTVSNNTSDGINGAAGMDIIGNDSRIQIVNSTITGNRAADGAGGIKSIPENVVIVNSTIVNNRSAGIGPEPGHVGGIHTRMLGWYFSGIYNTIIARNTGQINDINMLFPIGNNNFIGIGDCPTTSCSPKNGVDGNIVGTAANPFDPRLGQLVDNGGGIPTHLPLTQSPVIDRGTNYMVQFAEGYFAPFLKTDQRGFERLAGGTIDIGAVEFGAQPVFRASIIGQVTVADGRGISGARVIVTSPGGEQRIVHTNPFGYYRVVGLQPDMTYSVTCEHKFLRFASQSIFAEENSEYLDFRTK